MVPFGRRQSSVRLLSHVPKNGRKAVLLEQITLTIHSSVSKLPICLLCDYHFLTKF